MIGEVKMEHIDNNNGYQGLLNCIACILVESRNRVCRDVNNIMLNTYWNIGKYIVEFEQRGCEKAEYGTNLLTRLSKDLTRLYGKGFGRSNLQYMRKLYVAFQKNEDLSAYLGWSHYYEILKLDNPLEMAFYRNECERERWSVRELKRQISSMLFHRIALSKDKEGVLKLAARGAEVQRPQDILRDPFVLEFAGLPDVYCYREGDLEKALVSNLSQFLLELGRGFAFVGQQYRFSVAGRHYYVDLVFYHVILKTYVLIDLKRDEVQHEDIGQMNFYLNYFRNEVCTEGDNEPIGIVLGATADRMTMEYAMGGISNQLFVSRYQVYLPDRETLEGELWRMMKRHERNLEQQKELHSGEQGLSMDGENCN